MFEDTLMIIKPDYMHKRRPVLLKLLASGFQIQGSRKLNFSPELAAEFYADYADEKGFMLEVILLSKGISEAFILTKEKAVQELICIMICYFGSASELERNIHITKHTQSVAREITFIFPNYIHEPIQLFDKSTFCNRPMIKPLISEIYDIMQNVDCSQDDWKRRMADYLVRSNPSLPHISNQCQVAPDMGMQEKGQQTTVTYKSAGKSTKAKKKAKAKSVSSSATSISLLSSSTPHSSMLLTTSSCVSCGGFDHTEPCASELDLNKRIEPQSDEPVCEDEETIWKEIVVYEEMQPEEEHQVEFKTEPDVYDEGLEHRLDESSSGCDEPARAPVAAAIETDSGADEQALEMEMEGEDGGIDQPPPEVTAAAPAAAEPAAAAETAPAEAAPAEAAPTAMEATEAAPAEATAD